MEPSARDESAPAFDRHLDGHRGSIAGPRTTCAVEGEPAAVTWAVDGVALDPGSTQPACVQRAMKASNTPGCGWVIRVSPTTLPELTGISAVLASAWPGTGGVAGLISLPAEVLQRGERSDGGSDEHGPAREFRHGPKG